jgi:squalene synthase HpnC
VSAGAVPPSALATRFGPAPGDDPGALLARATGENFPVAPRWLPRGLRDDLMVIYGFARLADQLGDEAAGDRLALLDGLAGDLARAAEARAVHPLVRRLEPALRSGRLPVAPFERLIEANRVDQRVRRYETWAQLQGYCALSASPVGELVLHALGAATPERIARSDRVCTALQLLEHCQDLAEDRARGRVYLPGEDLARFGVGPADLDVRPAPPGLRGLVGFEVARARALLAEAEPLVASLPGAGALAVAGFAAGGRAAADALARAGFDPSGGAPRPRRRDTVRHAAALLWRAWVRPGARHA